jgi:15-cis-phytoene synthase
MSELNLIKIFKKGSKTYFYSSVFFPKKIRKNVIKLYAFVRTADDLVDSVPQKKTEFNLFVKKYEQALKGIKSNDIVIDSFIELMNEKKIEKKWIKSFLNSMKSDLNQKKFKSLKEVEKYMYGSAEVIGLCMSKILELNSKAEKHAMLLGKSMQYINFIRDIEEDWKMNRTYFPENEFKEFNINELTLQEINLNKLNFEKFIKKQLSHYWKWQKKAEQGFKFIPKKSLLPIKTASELYKWTAKQIELNPSIVLTKKIKPSIPRILCMGSINALTLTVKS